MLVKSIPQSISHFKRTLTVRTQCPAKTIASLLRQSSKSHLPIPTALSIHAHISKSNSASNPFTYNVIISSLLDQNDLRSACKLFEEMPKRNIISYTIMIDAHMKRGLIADAFHYFERNPFQSVVSYTAAINGLVQNGLKFEALSLFRQMIGSRLMPNGMTFTTVIKACIMYEALLFGISVAGLAVKTNFDMDVSVCNSLITMYSKMGEVGTAKRVFNEMSERDVVSWTALLDVYFEAGDLKEACEVFASMPEKNTVSWSTMIARLGQNDGAEEALRFFSGMVREGFEPNLSCFASVLSASSSHKSLLFGTNVHSFAVKFGFETNVFVSSSLIDMYAKCGKSHDAHRVFDAALDKNIVVWNSILGGCCFNCRVEDAEEIFKQMPRRNIVSWNSMISGYDRSEQYAKAVETFDGMLVLGLLPTPMTFSSVLHSCANLPSLEKGKNFHGKILKLGLEDEVFVGTSLINMYSKSGDTESSGKVFSRMPHKNEVSWTAMIQGLADCGHGQKSLDLFEEMKNTKVVPTETVFLSVLFACAHCGLVDKGFHYFQAMEKDCGISPNVRHYTCMVDLLSRAGRLREAEEFIGGMPIEPEDNTWAALLSGCCTYKNEVIGERAAKKLRELGSKASSAGYVLLSNIYASSARWNKVAKLRKLMREVGVKKGGGSSWIEIRGRFHPFYSWDANHIESLEIYVVLELLMSEMLKT